MLALNIVQRDYAGLLKPLDMLQVAPVGFLVVEKFFVNILGPNEYALRLFPLIAGIASVILFALLAKKMADKHIALIALSIFAIEQHLVYYSSEAKQYSLDVAAYLIPFLVAEMERWTVRSYTKSLMLGLGGAAIMWLSHASVFVLAAVAIALCLNMVARKSFDSAPKLLVITGFWLASFTVNYLVILAPDENSPAMKTNWAGSFMPFPPTAPGDLIWFWNRFGQLFTNSFGLVFGLLIALLFIVGIAKAWRHKQYTLIGLLLPAVIHLCASALRLYPFEGRLILYTAPGILLLVSSGICALANIYPQRRLAVELALTLVIVASVSGAFDVLPEVPHEEIKESLAYLKQHFVKGDAIYVYGSAVPAFDFYRNAFVEPGTEISRGRLSDELSDFEKDVAHLKGKGRVWIVISHIPSPDAMNPMEKIIAPGLVDKYEKLNSYSSKNTAVFLYRFK